MSLFFYERALLNHTQWLVEKYSSMFLAYPIYVPWRWLWLEQPHMKQ